MNLKRIPLALFVMAVLVKLLLVVCWRLFHAGGLLSALTTYDPVAFVFAETIIGALFDQRRIVPGQAEGAVFDILLIVGSGLECLLIGYGVRYVLRRQRS